MKEKENRYIPNPRGSLRKSQRKQSFFARKLHEGITRIYYLWISGEITL
jgi:hypothetical protein